MDGSLPPVSTVDYELSCQHCGTNFWICSVATAVIAIAEKRVAKVAMLPRSDEREKNTPDPMKPKKITEIDSGDTEKEIPTFPCRIKLPMRRLDIYCRKFG
jgi:hypothetical protein